MSVVSVIDSKGKEPIKKAMYWLWLLFFSFLLFKFFWDFDRDNYFFLFVLIPALMFTLAGLIGYHSKYDIVFQVKAFLRKLIKGQGGAESDTTKMPS